MKAEMTSFDIAALVHELNLKVKSAKIENIYQTSPTTILLRLHQLNQPTLQLLMEAGKRVHLTSYVLKKPLKPPAFCMALRKHLKNGKISDIQQHEFERVITASVQTKPGVFQLVAELFGEGNIILVSPQNIILYALAYRRMRDRNILRGETFRHAPLRGKNPIRVSRMEFEEIKQYGCLEIVKALTKFLSIGGLYAEEILQRAEVNKNTTSEALREQELDRIFTQFRTILTQLTTGKCEPAIVVNERGEWVDAVPIKLTKYSDLAQKPYKSFNEALDEYYTKALIEERVSKADKEVERELAKKQRMLQQQQKTMEDLIKTFELNKKIGDLIYAHLGELQLLVQKTLDEKRKGKTWEQITSEIKQDKQARQVPAIYFHSLDHKRRILNVSIENINFPLDLALSVQANAASFYERMKKAEKKMEGAMKALNETKAQIQGLEKIRERKTEEILEKVSLKRIEKAWYEKFRWFNSSDGFLVIGGRDATTNEILIKKYLEPQDIVFHADVVGAPFVVVKTEGKTMPEQTLREAAQLAASYSSAWREMLSAVDVYWVRPEQISKTPPPGQYLKKGSFIIRGTKNHVRKVPLRVAIGIQKKDEQIRVIGGPTYAICRQTNTYVEVLPGDETSGTLAKQIRYLLSRKAAEDWQRTILEIPIEQIQQYIPLGKGAIFQVKK